MNRYVRILGNPVMLRAHGIDYCREVDRTGVSLLLCCQWRWMGARLQCRVATSASHRNVT